MVENPEDNLQWAVHKFMLQKNTLYKDKLEKQRLSLSEAITHSDLKL